MNSRVHEPSRCCSTMTVANSGPEGRESGSRIAAYRFAGGEDGDGGFLMPYTRTVPSPCFSAHGLSAVSGLDLQLACRETLGRKRVPGRKSWGGVEYSAWRQSPESRCLANEMRGFSAAGVMQSRRVVRLSFELRICASASPPKEGKAVGSIRCMHTWQPHTGYGIWIDLFSCSIVDGSRKQSDGRRCFVSRLPRAPTVAWKRIAIKGSPWLMTPYV